MATVFVIPVSQSVNMDGEKQVYDKEPKSQQIY